MSGDQVKIVAGVQVARASEAVLAKAFERLNEEMPEDKDAAVRALVKHYRTNHDELFKCEDCGMLNVSDDTHCPACGDRLDDDDVGQSDDENTEEDQSESEEVEEVEDEEDEEQEPSVKSDVVISKPPTLELVKSNNDEQPVDLARFTEKDLDEAVDHCRKLQAAALQDMWLLGNAIKTEFFDGQKWKLRVDPQTGRGRYRSFKQFVAEELGFTVRWAYTIMDIAAYFDQNQVSEIGTKKLSLILQAPEAHREHLIDRAKHGMTRRELEDEVAKIKGNRKPKSATAKAPEATPPAKRLITVAIKPGRKMLAMHKQDAGKDGTPVVAKRLADKPCAELVLENDVVMTFKLVGDSKKGLKLAIETRRA